MVTWFLNGDVMTQPNLFKKAIVYTDIHLGLRHNSKEHNEDCLSFLKWMVETAKIQGAETCIFMGDFQHHRNSINVLTQNYMLDAMQLMNDNFEHTFFLVGNHDMFFRESRNVVSTKFAKLYPNITLVDKPMVIKEVALIPWLVEDEWLSVTSIKSKYMFGHLELPGFKMNAHVEMPDHGKLNSTHFENQEYVFSGHFHKRQTKGKINYIGNPFGHNYADVWDFERGAMILAWGGEPEFIDYTDGPRFININLSALLANPDLHLKPKTYIQVVLDVDITYEEATFLRETLMEQFEVREFKIIRPQMDEASIEFIGDVSMKTVDTIVAEQLINIDSDVVDAATLIEIYDRL